MSNYRAIIFDLDGTAIPNRLHGMPSQKLIEAVAKAKSHLKLCAATGRPLANAKSILDALDLDEPCIISAGTQIVNPKTGDILWETVIEEADVARILTICQPYQYELLLHTETPGEGLPAFQRVASGSVNVVYVMGCSEADATAIIEQIDGISAVTAAGVTSWTPESIDVHITPRNATKEHAVAELLKLLALQKEEVIGVGDANNDIHLFQAVGHKVAMGNATDLLKSHADEICESVDNDGLADLIQRIAKAQ